MKPSAKSLITIAVFIAAIFTLFSCEPETVEPSGSTTENGNKGDTLWIYEIPETDNLIIPNSFMAIGKNGDIYFEVRDPNNSQGARIYAITKDGQFKWKTQPLDDNGLNTTKQLNSPIVVGDDGTIYCTSGPYLYSINPDNGQANAIWECPKDLTRDGQTFNAYSNLTNLCLTNDGNLVVQNVGTFVNFVGAMFCITPSGQLKWTSLRQDPNYYPISIGPDGNIYDVGYLLNNNNWECKLIVSDPNSGNILWTEAAFPWNSENKVVFTSDGDVIFPLKQQDNSLARMKTSDRSIIWSIKNKGGYSYSTVDESNNTFSHFYNVGNFFIPYNATGTIASPQDIYMPLHPNVDSKGNLTGGAGYTAANLASTDKQGNKLWEYKNLGANGKSVTIANNVLYFSSFYDFQTSKNRNRIFAIKWDASLYQGGWPRYTHDNRNTSNFNKW